MTHRQPGFTAQDQRDGRVAKRKTAEAQERQRRAQAQARQELRARGATTPEEALNARLDAVADAIKGMKKEIVR